jgi:hypothetical protein
MSGVFIERMWVESEVYQEAERRACQGEFLHRYKPKLDNKIKRKTMRRQITWFEPRAVPTCFIFDIERIEKLGILCPSHPQ